MMNVVSLRDSSMLRWSLLAGLLSVLPDVDHLPCALGLAADGRPLHPYLPILALLSGLLYRPLSTYISKNLIPFTA